MKIIRVLIYEGDEAAIMHGLAARAVQGERILGNGVKCTEQIFPDAYLDDIPDGPDLRADVHELRDKVAALPRPSWWTHGKEAADGE